MFAGNAVLILLATLALVTTEESYRVDALSFDDCESALEHGQSLKIPVTIECHLVMQIGPDTKLSLSTIENQEVLPAALLKDYVKVAEYEFDNRDASGVTFISDDTVVITFQDSLQFRGLDGDLKHTIGPLDGDIEGLEYQSGRFFAVAEHGSTHIDLQLDGMNVMATREQALPLRGVECIAHDPRTGRTYYGQESTGTLFDDQFDPVMDFQRDLAACAVFRGELMVLVSHPWRQSVWSRVDMQRWKVLEERLLPAGNWEGVACRGEICVLVRELSEKSNAAMVIFKLGQKVETMSSAD